MSVGKPGRIFDRDVEWRHLEAFAGRTGTRTQLGVVSGRRRQGKTYLLDALTQETSGFYFGATQATETESLRLFSDELGRHLATPVPPRFTDWDEAVRYLFAADLGGGPVVIDEFPYLTRAGPALPSILQREIDRASSAGGPGPSLILCGSAMSVMGGLLAGSAPLRGRANLELVVQPFPYRLAAGYWQVDDPRLAVMLHSIVGGTPAYRRFVNDDLPTGVDDLDAWVLRTVLDPATPLFREARHLLEEETDVRDTALYHSLLAAVAAGNASRGGIASYIGRRSADIGHHLNVLEDCGLLRREPDVFRAGRSSYRIAEPLITFYQSVMRPRWALLESGRAEAVWADARACFAAQVLGPHFEQLCREHAADGDPFGALPGEVGAGVVADPARRGQIEVDVVVFAPAEPGRSRRIVALGEARWDTVLGERHVPSLRAPFDPTRTVDGARGDEKCAWPHSDAVVEAVTAGADLVVLGAGPSGLAAAWRAARRGLSVVVLERALIVGGMAASFDVAGIRVDHGSHRLHPATGPEILADLHGLLGEDLQLRPRNGRLRIGANWVGFPLRPAELARRLPRRLLARMAFDAATAPVRRRGTPPASYADALRRGLGPGLYEALYAPFAEKLWGLPGERIDAEQARRRVTADTPWKVAATVLRPPSGQGKVFHYPRRGFGQIVDAVAAAGVDAGARIETGVEATSVVPGRDGVVVRTADGREIVAGHVFSTVPLTALARLVHPGGPTAGLGFRAMVLLYLVLEQDHRWTPYDAHYLPGADTPVTRVSEPVNYRVSADDPTDRTVLCVEIPCAADDGIWSATDGDLAARVTDELGRAGLPPVRPVQVVTRRLRHVYPVYDVGYGDRLAALDAWAAAIPGVTTFGRLGLFAHDNTHHAFTMAYDAVDALDCGGIDAAAWAAARERFAAHVVED